MRISDWSSDVCSSDLMTKDRAAQFKMCALAQRHVQRHAAQLPTHVEDVEIQSSAVFYFDDIITNRDCIFSRRLDQVARRPFSCRHKDAFGRSHGPDLRTRGHVAARKRVV